VEKFTDKLERLKVRLQKDASSPPIPLPAAKEAAKAEASAFQKRAERDNHRLDMDRKRLNNQSLRDDISSRKDFAYKLFGLAVAWLFAVYWMVLLNGGGFVQLEISDNVILAMIGSTTVNVLGLFYIVANYLFPTKKPTPKPRSRRGPTSRPSP